MKDSRVEIQENISVARSLLLKAQPFFGSILFLMKQEITTDPRLATCATNGKAIFFNADFVSKLKIKEITFVIAHEILHCVLDHFGRKDGRKHQLWNYACDYAVNLLLIKHKVGVKPTRALHEEKYTGWSAEEIYRDLEEMSSESLHKQLGGKDTLDDHEYSFSDLSDEEKEELVEELRDTLGRALKAGAGSALGRELGSMLFTEQSQVNWKEVLKESLISPLYADQTFMKPNRRASVLDVILPSSKKEETVDVCIAIDASGSISKQMLNVFLTEIHSIMSLYSSFSLKVWSFDTKCYNYCEFTENNLDELYGYKVTGGGGTLFECNWDFLQEKGIQPSQLLVYTDGYPCRTWGDPSYCPTVFCLCDAQGITPPFGQYVHVSS